MEYLPSDLEAVWENDDLEQAMKLLGKGKNKKENSKLEKAIKILQEYSSNPEAGLWPEGSPSRVQPQAPRPMTESQFAGGSTSNPERKVWEEKYKFPQVSKKGYYSNPEAGLWPPSPVRQAQAPVRQAQAPSKPSIDPITMEQMRELTKLGVLKPATPSAYSSNPESDVWGMPVEAEYPPKRSMVTPTESAELAGDTSLLQEQLKEKQMKIQAAAETVAKAGVKKELKKVLPKSTKAAEKSKSKGAIGIDPKKDPTASVIDKIIGKAEKLRETPKDLDLTGIMGLVDDMYGTKMAATYKKPTTRQEALKRADKLDDLADLYKLKMVIKDMDYENKLKLQMIKLSRKPAVSDVELRGVRRELRKQLVKNTDSYEEDVSRLEQIGKFFRTGKRNLTYSALGPAARVISTEVGRLTNEDLKRIMQDTIGTDWAGFIGYIEDKPDIIIPENVRRALIDMVELGKDTIRKKHIKKLRNLEYIYGIGDIAKKAGMDPDKVFPEIYRRMETVGREDMLRQQQTTAKPKVTRDKALIILSKDEKNMSLQEAEEYLNTLEGL